MLWFCKTQPKKTNKHVKRVLGVDKWRQTHMRKSHNKKNNGKCTSKVGLGEENHTWEN